jgi:transcriptional antiterminator NusG
MSKRWYVIQSYAGYEKYVKNKIEEKIKLHGLEDFFGRILVPTEEVIEMKKGQKRRSERKYFPGYILIEMRMEEQSWQLVRSTPRVSRFVGISSDCPTPINKQEAEKILLSIKNGASSLPRPSKTFQAGQVVRVLEGPFTDFTGVVEDVNYDKARLHIAVSIFGRATPVELEFSQVEKDI